MADRYQWVIIEEGRFVRRHFVHGTFATPDMRIASYKVLQRHLKRANMVFIMQDALSDSDVTFYRSMGSFNAESVRRMYMPQKALCETLTSTGDELLWTTGPQKCVLGGEKVFVCCSCRRDAEVLYTSIR
jgi:hypothetical protein